MTATERLPEGPGRRPLDWATVLAQHDRWLRVVVLARLGEPQAVDEVLQEVALAAVAQRAPLADPTRVAAWLRRLAVRQALLYRRRQGRRRKLVDRYANHSNGKADSVGDPLDWLILDERRRLVREALSKLPANDAEVLLLKYAEGWSCRDLAGHLGLGESAVEARLHRARNRLRAALSRFEFVEVRS